MDFKIQQKLWFGFYAQLQICAPYVNLSKELSSWKVHKNIFRVLKSVTFISGNFVKSGRKFNAQSYGFTIMVTKDVAYSQFYLDIFCQVLTNDPILFQRLLVKHTELVELCKLPASHFTEIHLMKPIGTSNTLLNFSLIAVFNISIFNLIESLALFS